MNTTSESKTLSPEQESYIRDFSFGAFLFPFIWALGNRLYGWALLYFIPLVNIYVWLKLSFSGRSLSWQRGWSSFEEFKQRQRALAYVVGILWGLTLILAIIAFSQFVITKRIVEPEPIRTSGFPANY